MMLCRLTALAAALCLGSPQTASAKSNDFNDVGKTLSTMIQNGHFSPPPYNEALGREFLREYLKALDPQKLYLTQEDVDGFDAAYGARLHQLLLESNSMAAALEIFRVFMQRLESRIRVAQQLLTDPSFDFTIDESVMLTRRHAAWPKNETEAAAAWRLHIKEAVLAETLRREMLAKLAKEQGKPDPNKGERPPAAKISQRYHRLLQMWGEADDEEIASIFLQSIARTYDPHSDYLSHREMESFRIGMTHELIGIGAQLQGDDDGATKIVGIVIGGPADREGTLKLNDRIVGVDSLASGRPEDMTDVMFMRIDKVTSLIRGTEGTKAALKVEPANGPPGETRIVVIERGRVEMKDEQASGELIEILDKQEVVRRFGVITLPSFYADFEDGDVRCSVDVERILKRLVAEEIDGLLVDLRNNGGGSLDEVRRITGFFIPPGPVVQVKSAVGRAQARSSNAGKPLYNGPMVVATDRSSASASEILAGALQDYQRAVLVGEASTYGKGTVQQIQDISQKMPLWSVRNRDRAGHLKLTIQKFYRPSGSSTQKEGVVPDIVLPSPADAMEIGEAYLDRALPHDRIAPASRFRPGDRNHLFVQRLLEESNARVAASRDFAYVIEDVMKNSARLKANRLSLDIGKRRQEIAEAEETDRQRNRERRERFARMAQEDRGHYRFFKITLDGLDQAAALQPYEPSGESRYMRLAKEHEAELDDTPEWPTGLDPVKRESLHVLRDLVEVTETARMTGIIK